MDKNKLLATLPCYTTETWDCLKVEECPRRKVLAEKFWSQLQCVLDAIKNFPDEDGNKPTPKPAEPEVFKFTFKCMACGEIWKQTDTDKPVLCPRGCGCMENMDDPRRPILPAGMNPYLASKLAHWALPSAPGVDPTCGTSDKNLK